MNTYHRNINLKGRIPSWRALIAIASLPLATLVTTKVYAVPLDTNSLPACFERQEDPNMGTGRTPVEFYLCEDENFFKAKFVIDLFEPGTLESFDWSGEHWEGNVTFGFSETGAESLAFASGEAQHDGADVWEFGELEATDNSDTKKLTAGFDRGSVPHNGEFDFYAAKLRFDRDLRGLGSGIARDVRFLLEVEGSHGTGPFIIPVNPFRLRDPDPDDRPREIIDVSEPASLALLGLGLVGIRLTRRRKESK